MQALQSVGPFVVVTHYSPYRILAHSPGEDTIMGCSVDLLRGRSFQIFQGPNSDWFQLGAAIKDAEPNCPLSIEMDLYDIHGTCERKRIVCTPVCDGGGKAVASRICISPIAQL